MNYKVVVGLVTFNGEKYLPFCLDSLKRQTFRNFCLFVVDNNSQDGSVSFLRKHYPEAEIVQNKKNLGFSRAYNQIIHWTKSDYILCLNQDVILEPDFLEILVSFLDRHPQVGSLSGKIYRWDFEKNQKTKIIDTVGLKVFRNHRVIDEGQGKEDRGEYNQIKEIFGPSAAVALYRRKALEDIKVDNEYFDEDFFAYKEDVDLAFRLRIAGWSSFFVPQAIAYHDRTTSQKGDIIKNRSLKSQFANYHSYRNHLLVILKNEFFSNLILCFPQIFWYEFKKFVYLLIFERKTLKGLVDILKLLPKVIKKRKIIKQKRKIKAKDLRKWFNSNN